MTPSKQIQVEVREEPRGRVARVVVDHPVKLNILDPEMMDALAEAFENLAGDAMLRAAVLTGAGERAFIGGADIGPMSRLSSPKEARRFISRLHAACDAVRRLPVPVIARIDGYCIGGGLEIAASCDLRAAGLDSRFSMPEVRVGIPSVIEAALLPRLMGWGKARELIYTGDLWTAEEAARAGLVERAVPREELDAVVDGWVESILKAGPRAIRLQKALIREWERLPVPQAIERGVQVFGEAFETSEPATLMGEFLNRPRG